MVQLQAEETLTAISVAGSTVPITKADPSWHERLSQRRSWLHHLERQARGSVQQQPMDAKAIAVMASMAGIPVTVVPAKKK